MVMAGGFGRLSKLIPGLPKGLLPWLVLLIGYAATFALGVFRDDLPAAEAALAAWTGLGWGMAAIGGHEALKPLLSQFVGPEMAIKILGKLPAAKGKS